MIAVDSNVLAYLLIDGRQTADARRLLERDPDWHSDAFALVEFTNVLATAIRVRGLAHSDATRLLAQAQSVIELGLHATAHVDALTLAAQLRISAYDARYIAVAQDLGLRLVTEDSRLRKAAPKLTQSLADALAAA